MSFCWLELGGNGPECADFCSGRLTRRRRRCRDAIRGYPIKNERTSKKKEPLKKTILLGCISQKQRHAGPHEKDRKLSMESIFLRRQGSFCFRHDHRRPTKSGIPRLCGHSLSAQSPTIQSLVLVGTRRDRAPWIRSSKKETGPAHEIMDRLGSFVSRSSRSILTDGNHVRSGKRPMREYSTVSARMLPSWGCGIASRHGAPVFHAHKRATCIRAYCDRILRNRLMRCHRVERRLESPGRFLQGASIFGSWSP